MAEKKKFIEQSWQKYMKSVKFRQAICATAYFFLTSTQRSVVIPSLWLYLKLTWSLQDAENYYAASLAILNVVALFISPLCGYLGGIGVRVKSIVVISNQFEVIGNLLYLLAPRPEFVLIGRMICGLGAGCEPILYTEMSNLTTEDERTKYMASGLVARQFGILIGPAFTLIISRILTKPVSFLTVYNSPGLVMAIMWALHTLMTLLIYPNIDENGQEINLTPPSIREPMKFKQYLKSLFIASESEKPLIQKDEKEDGPIKEKISAKFYLKYNILVLLLINSVGIYGAMALETSLAPFLNSNFEWDEKHVSYVYFSGSVLILLICGILFRLTKYFHDYYMLVFGSWFCTLDYLFIALIISFMDFIPKITVLILVLTGVFLHIIGIPFLLVSSESMFSKCVPSYEMHRGQTILRTLNNIANILGPAVGGGLWFHTDYVFYTMSGSLFILTIMVSSAERKFFNFT